MQIPGFYDGIAEVSAGQKAEWAALGRPYDRARALLESGPPDDLSAAFYDLGPTREAPRLAILGAFLWIGAAVVLHLAGRRVLGWLKT